MGRCREADLCIGDTPALDFNSGITMVMRITILILFLMIFEPGLSAQSMVLYSKKGRILKSNELFTIENRSIVYRDSNLVKKVIPVKSLKEIRYALKSYNPSVTYSFLQGHLPSVQHCYQQSFLVIQHSWSRVLR